MKASILFVLAILVLTVSPSVSALANQVEEFQKIDCDAIKQIAHVRFLCPESKAGIMTTYGTFTPLHHEVPQNINVPLGAVNPMQSGISAAFLVQKIPTEMCFSYYLDGGLIFRNVLNGIYRLFPKPISAIVYKILVIPEIILDLIAHLVCWIFNAGTDLTFVVVDNALNERVVMAVEGSGSVTIPAASQMNIAFKKGVRSIKVTRKSTGETIEEFKLNAVGGKDKSDYVYNIGGINTYNVSYAAYTK